MAKKNHEKAFPKPACGNGDNTYQFGMDIRDWFAGMALQGMYAADGCGQIMPIEHKVIQAYEVADKMIEERKKAP